MIQPYYFKLSGGQMLGHEVEQEEIGAKVVSHARYVMFQMAEVLVSKRLFQEILERIHRLKPAGIGYG